MPLSLAFGRTQKIKIRPPDLRVLSPPQCLSCPPPQLAPSQQEAGPAELISWASAEQNSFFVCPSPSSPSPSFPTRHFLQFKGSVLKENNSTVNLPRLQHGSHAKQVQLHNSAKATYRISVGFEITCANQLLPPLKDRRSQEPSQSLQPDEQRPFPSLACRLPYPPPNSTTDACHSAIVMRTRFDMDTIRQATTKAPRKKKCL